MQIPNGKCFVNNQNVGPANRCYAEGQTHMHSGRIQSHGPFEPIFQFRESVNFFHELFQRIIQILDLTAHQSILAAGQFGVHTEP